MSLMYSGNAGMRVVHSSAGRGPAAVSAGFGVWLRSPVWLTVAAAGIVSLLTVGLLMSSGPVTWDRFLKHQNMWVVTVGPGFIAAVAGYVGTVEKTAARAIAVRSVTPWIRTVAGILLLLWWALVLYITHFLTAFLAYWALTGSSFDDLIGPLRDIAVLTLTCLAAAVGYLVFLRLVVEASGSAGALGGALVFIISGLLAVEAPMWPFVPSAWAIRPALPLLGTHANGTALDGDQISGTGWAIALSIAFGLVLCAVRALLSRLSDRKMRRSSVVYGKKEERSRSVQRHRERMSEHELKSFRSFGGALLVAVLRRSGVIVLLALSIASVAWLRVYLTAEDAASVFALLVLPLGCSVLPAIVVSRWRKGMRAVATRAPSARGHAFRLLLLEGVILALAVIGGVLVTSDVTTTAGEILRSVVLLWIFGMMLMAFSTWLISAAGALATLLITVAGTIAGLLIGGNQALRSSFGLFVPWSWAGNLTEGSLFFTLTAALIAVVVFTAASIRILARSTSKME